MISESYKTIIEPIIDRANNVPDQLVMVFIHEDGTEEKINASGFYRESTRFAEALTKIGIGTDDLVVVVLKHSKELISAFWGCLLLGSIASIFPYLTEKLDPEIYMDRVKTLVSRSGAKAVITFADFKDDLSALLAETGCQVLCTEEILTENESGAVFKPEFIIINQDKVALLQHSSGTTGLQKGVALSHQSILNQIRSLGFVLGITPKDRIISWLPLYHDMGLIGGFVLPIVAGIPLILLSPFHWVRDPKILFSFASKYQATISWLPNFAFNHFVRGIRRSDLEQCDLRSLRALISCSEPVRKESFDSFLEKFKEFGVTAEILQASFALAENTFAATQTKLGEPPKYDWIDIRSLQEEGKAIRKQPEIEGSIALVSNGKPIPGTEIAIAGSDGSMLPERCTGEIILRSNCMLTGYHNRKDITDLAIKDGWFSTGDIGYMAEGELYVSGRKKDLIIVGGKNIFPQDLEAIANTVSGVHPGRAVAFGVDDPKMGSEGVVLVCEIEANCNNDESISGIETEIRQKVVRETEIVLMDVKLVSERWLIKTSSGKIARKDNRDKYFREFRKNWKL